MMIVMQVVAKVTVTKAVARSVVKVIAKAIVKPSLFAVVLRGKEGIERCQISSPGK